MRVSNALIMFKKYRGRKRTALLGTSGTGDINVDGTDYLATFNTDLSTTAADFVTSHAADILSNHGVVVTQVGSTEILEFRHGVNDYTLSITNVSGDLSGNIIQ